MRSLLNTFKETKLLSSKKDNSLGNGQLVKGGKVKGSNGQFPQW